MKTYIIYLEPLIKAREAYLTALLASQGFSRSSLNNGTEGYTLNVGMGHVVIGRYYSDLVEFFDTYKQECKK